jgi:hypothetical protein
MDICLVQERACIRFHQTLIGGGELLFLLHPLWFFIAVVLFGQSVALQRAWAAAPTITTLSVTSGGNAVTTVASGSVVTLTATAVAGGTPVTPGQVNFCDATAKFCTDIHLLGTAQLTANGTATLKFRPGVGSHRPLRLRRASLLRTHRSQCGESTADAWCQIVAL